MHDLTRSSPRTQATRHLWERVLRRVPDRWLVLALKEAVRRAAPDELYHRLGVMELERRLTHGGDTDEG